MRGLNFVKKKTWVFPKNHSEYAIIVCATFDRDRSKGLVLVERVFMNSYYDLPVKILTKSCSTFKEMDDFYNLTANRFYHEVYPNVEKNNEEKKEE